MAAGGRRHRRGSGNSAVWARRGRWHDLIGIPTLADAILDRVIHNAIASISPARACASGSPRREIDVHAKAGLPDPRRDGHGKRRAPLRRKGKRAPPAVTHRHPRACGYQIQPANPGPLDERLRAKHRRIDPRKQTPGGRHQIVFLPVVEERGLLHAPVASATSLYAEGSGLCAAKRPVARPGIATATNGRACRSSFSLWRGARGGSASRASAACSCPS
jgi:hypothetical protein